MRKASTSSKESESGLADHPSLCTNAQNVCFTSSQDTDNEQLGNCEEDLPKKPVGRLSVNCRPTHYRQFTDRLPTANRQATDSFPKKKIVEKTRIKHDIETIIISIDITYLPIDGKTISSDMFIESFWNAKRIYYSRKTTRQSMKSDLEVILSQSLKSYKKATLEASQSCCLALRTNRPTMPSERCMSCVSCMYQWCLPFD